MSQLEPNVFAFLDKASKDYGDLKSHNFSMMMWTCLTNGKINSPIEQMYFVAINLLADNYSLPIKQIELESDDSCQLSLRPQVEIGTYRVDYLAEYLDFNGKLHQVVIELDGHDFHDKDKRQRAYEKSRDRYLTRQGFTILHFTGSELFKDPYKSVMETFAALGVISNDEFDAYDHENPFGIK